MRIVAAKFVKIQNAAKKMFEDRHIFVVKFPESCSVL